MKTSSILTFLALLMFSTVASAGCNGRSVKGTWHLFISTSGTEEGWQSCTIGVNGDGEFLGSSTCVSNAGDESNVTNGKLNVNKKCDFTGQFDVGADTYVIANGQISRNKFDMAGTGFIGDSTTDIFSFDGVRQ